MILLQGLISKLAKQRNMSPHIGAMLNVYSATVIIYAPLTLMGVATTLYGLWGGEIIHKWLPWFTFPMLLCCMILIILLMMVLFYKVIIPSQIAFNMQQAYKHRNPLVADVQKILKQNAQSLERLEGIEKRLKDLEEKL